MINLHITRPHLLKWLLILAIILLTGCSYDLKFSRQPSKLEPLNEIQQQSNTNTSPVWLLFEQRLDYTQTLYRLNLDESNELESLLAIDMQKPENYYLSPTGQYAILRADGTLRVIDLISKREIANLESGPRLTRHFTTVEIDNDVAWSPQGDKFVFLVESRFLRTDIMMYDLSTGKLSQLTDDPSRKNAPTWSPDGKQLAFAVWESCGESLEYCSPEENYWNLAIINIDGSDYQLITDMAQHLPVSSEWTSNSLCRLNWSPDEKHIAFKSYCPATGVPTHDEVFVTRADGLQMFQLTEFGHIDYAHTYSMIWSPDSRYLVIAFSRNYIFDDLFDSSGFMIFDANSLENEPISVEIEGLSAYYINWSSDRKYVIASFGFEHSFLGQIERGQVMMITNTLPRVSSAGYWATDGYVTQWQDKLVKIMVPSGEINDLGIELEDGMILIGWR